MSQLCIHTAVGASLYVWDCNAFWVKFCSWILHWCWLDHPGGLYWAKVLEHLFWKLCKLNTSCIWAPSRGRWSARQIVDDRVTKVTLTLYSKTPHIYSPERYISNIMTKWSHKLFNKSIINQHVSPGPLQNTPVRPFSPSTRCRSWFWSHYQQHHRCFSTIYFLPAISFHLLFEMQNWKENF